MKKINIRNKTFKAIPEQKIVYGEMPLKWIDGDMKMGIKDIYKLVIIAAVGEKNADTIKAKAYCDERDEFDERIGTEVCSSKLEYKNHIRLAKAYSRAFRILTEASYIAEKLCRRHFNKANAIEDDLIRHYGKEPRV